MKLNSKERIILHNIRKNITKNKILSYLFSRYTLQIYYLGVKNGFNRFRK